MIGQIAIEQKDSVTKSIFQSARNVECQNVLLRKETESTFQLYLREMSV